MAFRTALALSAVVGTAVVSIGAAGTVLGTVNEGHCAAADGSCAQGQPSAFAAIEEHSDVGLLQLAAAKTAGAVSLPEHDPKDMWEQLGIVAHVAKLNKAIEGLSNSKVKEQWKDGLKQIEGLIPLAEEVKKHFIEVTGLKELQANLVEVGSHNAEASMPPPMPPMPLMPAMMPMPPMPTVSVGDVQKVQKELEHVLKDLEKKGGPILKDLEKTILKDLEKKSVEGLQSLKDMPAPDLQSLTKGVEAAMKQLLKQMEVALLDVSSKEKM